MEDKLFNSCNFYTVTYNILKALLMINNSILAVSPGPAISVSECQLFVTQC